MLLIQPLGHHAWKAMVIVSSFDMLRGVIEDRVAELPSVFSEILCKSLFALIKFRTEFDVSLVDPNKWAEKVTTPTLMAHGDIDSLISLERGRRLFNAIRSRDKLWITVTGANHNNILITPMPLYAAMGEWFVNHSR